MAGSVDENSNGLLAYYKMDTNEDFKIIDYSTNSYHASINVFSFSPMTSIVGPSW